MRRKCTCFCASFDHKLASTSKNTAAPLDHIYEDNPLSYCLSEKVNIRQGALQPQMGIGTIQPLTGDTTHPLANDFRGRTIRGELLVSNVHCKPYGRGTFAQESRVMPRARGREEGKACNMILAMHGTLLRIIYILRGNLVVTLTSCHFLMTEIIML